ncbi:MAG: DUF2062 domain-containing protein [Alphaproteobacteria bacterium]|nr:DUF2062 domain-containing protein [Alphaproteobacteria bacterium]MCK5555316.1 DUF2062 domain-containing protein [Alphaproteobacteria bacterium]
MFQLIRILGKKIRKLIWPSMSLQRLFRYYRHRMGRLKGTPYFIASGFATGFAISLTPFIGFHLVIGGAISMILRGSLGAMVLGSVVAGNPWTFPLIWASTYKLGKIMLGQHNGGLASSTLSHGISFSDMMEKPMELLLPMTLGSLPFVLLSWGISFYLVKHLIKGYKKERHVRINKR